MTLQIALLIVAYLAVAVVVAAWWSHPDDDVDEMRIGSAALLWPLTAPMMMVGVIILCLARLGGWLRRKWGR